MNENEFSGWEKWRWIGLNSLWMKHMEWSVSWVSWIKWKKTYLSNHGFLSTIFANKWFFKFHAKYNNSTKWRWISLLYFHNPNDKLHSNWILDFHYTTYDVCVPENIFIRILLNGSVRALTKLWKDACAWVDCMVSFS